MNMFSKVLVKRKYRRQVRKSNLNNLPTIYFDMDGVLAKWRSVSVEETFRQGFFREAEVDLGVLNLIRLLVSVGYDVKILSAAYNKQARKEKKEWLSEIGLGFLDVTFVPYGEPKAAFVSGKAILIDDYSQNLREWVSAYGHVGIKYYNGQNGTKGTWNGFSMTCMQGVGDMFQLVTNVAFHLATYVPAQHGTISHR